jgi:hypothetical protein
VTWRVWQRSLVAVAFAIAALLVASSSLAAVRRYALVIGNDRGDAGDLALRYAETDAQRVYDVLKDLGGFEPADMVLLRGEAAPRAQATLISLNDRIRTTIASGSEVLLFVYYSGHAGADALHMSGSRFDLAQLEQLVRGSAATFRVLAVDACRSGALTRVKSGHAAPPFDIRVDEHLAEQGLVFLTSSSANEDAQESDALKGSFFTHYFVSALLGAGDADGDGSVTLEEAYHYAYDATLRSSSKTLAGPQHPTYRYEIRGAGRLRITQLPVASTDRATLRFPSGRAYLVMTGSERGAVVGEVSDVAAGRRLSVRAGRYFVRGRASDALLEGDIDVAGGATLDVTDDRLHRIAYARLVRKGAGVSRFGHGPEAGYVFRTPLQNANTLCHGAFAGYALHFEALSLGARAQGCRAAFTNEVVRARSDAFDAELRVMHAWDLPVVTIDLGLALGGGVLRQTFETAGAAPARTSPTGMVALLLGLRLDLGAGFSLLAESGFVSALYGQRDEATASTSLGPFFTFRQAFGLAKVW